jgi:DNA invertase Pin-like site-specific DNA recombinase
LEKCRKQKSVLNATHFRLLVLANHRERQAQGIEKAKAEGKYQGRPVNTDLHKRVKELLQAGLGIRATVRHTSCSTTTVLRIKNEL